MILLSSIEFVTALYLTVFLLAVIRSAKLDFSYLGLNFFFLSGSMHVCFWCLILILGKIRMEESVLLPPKHFAVIMAIPGISFLVLVFFLLRINFYPDTLFFLEFPLITAFIFINVTTAFIYSQFCNLLKRNTDVLLLHQQIKLSEQYYEDLSLSQQRLKGIRHDMKNHLQSLCWMAARITPKSRETEEIQEYLGHLTQDIGEASQILSTGNMGLDAILSLKLGQAREEKITVQSKISVPKEIGLATEDGIIILGNLLDNAMKACRENPKEKRWIHLDIHYIPRTLFIRITNPLPFLQEGEKEQKIIVLGDADALSNKGILAQHGLPLESGNYQLMMGMFHWLSDHELPVDVRRPDPVDNELKLSEFGVKVWDKVIVWGIPSLLLVVYLFLWIRRRGR